jgi:hypothetical protein
MNRRSWMTCVATGCLALPLRFLNRQRPTRADPVPQGWVEIWRGDWEGGHWVIFDSPDKKRSRWYRNGRFVEEIPRK